MGNQAEPQEIAMKPREKKPSEKKAAILAKWKKLRKKKSFWILLVLCIVILVALGVFLRFRSRMKSVETEMTVQSAEAENGSISTTVSGTGSLEAAETIDVVALTGIEVEEVLVESGDTVTKGQTLATVKKASVASALIEVEESLEFVEDQLDSNPSDLEEVKLNAEYEELTDIQTRLTELYGTLTITATADGVIETVNIAADSEITKSSSSGSSSSSSSFMGSTGTASNILQVSTANVDNLTEATIVSDYTNLVIPSPATGEAPVTSIPSETTASQGYQVTKITWNCKDTVFQADTAYTAVVTMKALSGYRFDASYMPSMNGADYTWEITGTGEENTMVITATYAKTEADSNAGTDGSQDASQNTQNGNANNHEDANNDNSNKDSQGTDKDVDTNSGNGADAGTAPTTASSSSGGASNASASSASSADIYSAYETAAFTIISQENVKISLSVDELDILSVEEGQTATVTLDALEDQEFEGTITKVGTFGSSSGSSAKYTVEITIPKDEKMRIGMSASATIMIDEAEDAVLIPIAALQERGGSTFVYTEKGDDDSLSGEVEVETGLSNGSQVEILSGLEAGDTVYYLKAESSDDSSDAMGGFGGGGFPSGEMPSGSDFPSGGDMPSGGGRSGGQMRGN